MRYEKDYIISFRHGKGGYPTTVLVNAYNKAEAMEKCREFVEDNIRRHTKPEFINEQALAEERSNIIFHFGIVMNTIIDIRSNY